MQIWFLNESDNTLVYIGVALVIFACCFLLIEKYWKERANVSQLQLQDNNRVLDISESNDDNIQETTNLINFSE